MIVTSDQVFPWALAVEKPAFGLKAGVFVGNVCGKNLGKQVSLLQRSERFCSSRRECRPFPWVVGTLARFCLSLVEVIAFVLATSVPYTHDKATKILSSSNRNRSECRERQSPVHGELQELLVELGFSATPPSPPCRPMLTDRRNGTNPRMLLFSSLPISATMVRRSTCLSR